MRNGFAWIVVPAAVLGLWVSTALAPPAATRPALRAVNANPAPASRPAESYPPKALAEACQKAADELRAKLDKTFSIRVSPPFIVAGNMDMPDLKAYTEGSVVGPAGVMWKCYFQKRPDKPITVLLFADAKRYSAWAKTLFHDENVPHFGYYKRESRTMVMNIATGSGTLVHELTHSLIVYDFPDVPDWFNEGLASLHEGCSVEKDRIVGAVNWRLPDLKKAIEAGKLRSLADLLTADDFYGEQRGLNYAQARYFCMYMQKEGVLEKYYARLRDHHDGKRPSVDAVEKVFDKKLDVVEKAYLAWVKTLR